MKQSELLEKVQELEERTALIRCIVIGLQHNMRDMEICFENSIAELREMATSPLEKKTPKASQGGSSVRSNTPCKNYQSNPHAGSSRSSRKKG